MFPTFLLLATSPRGILSFHSTGARHSGNAASVLRHRRQRLIEKSAASIRTIQHHCRDNPPQTRYNPLLQLR
jgi:hypothetical protein